MRCWIGNEAEGDCRKKTLFVCASRLTKENVKSVVSLAKEHDCKRVYFGAGRRDVQAVSTLAATRLKASRLTVVVETTARNVRHALKVIPATVVLRQDVRIGKMTGRLVLKADNGKDWCAVSRSLVYTDITGLKDGLYKQDMEVRI
jgi:hypothetical protein